MKKIFLYGKLAREFGREFNFDVKSIAEAIRALEANFPGKFLTALKDGSYRVSKSADGEGVVGETVPMHTKAKEIHIEPVLSGAGGGGGGQSSGKGIAKIIIGVALIAFSIIAAPLTAGGSLNLGATAFSALGFGVSYGTIALIGTSLALSGVSTLLAADPRIEPKTLSERERPENRPSFIFQGAVNMTEQGGPVPLLYGKMQIGSVVVSSSISVEDVPV